MAMDVNLLNRGENMDSEKKLWSLIRNQRVGEEFKEEIVRRSLLAIWKKDVTILYHEVVTRSTTYPDMWYSSEFVIAFVVKTGVDRFVGKKIKKIIKEEKKSVKNRGGKKDV